MRLINSFVSKAHCHGNIYLFDALTACSVIEFAESKSVRILGLDAFRIWDAGIQPDYSFNCNISHKEKDTWALAKKHLSNFVHSNIYFELILDE